MGSSDLESVYYYINVLYYSFYRNRIILMPEKIKKLIHLSRTQSPPDSESFYREILSLGTAVTMVTGIHLFWKNNEAIWTTGMHPQY